MKWFNFQEMKWWVIVYIMKQDHMEALRTVDGSLTLDRIWMGEAGSQYIGQRSSTFEQEKPSMGKTTFRFDQNGYQFALRKLQLKIYKFTLISISFVESKFSMETTRAFFMVEKEDFYIVYVSTMVIVL